MSAEPRPAEDGGDDRLEDTAERKEAVRPLPPGAKRGDVPASDPVPDERDADHVEHADDGAEPAADGRDVDSVAPDTDEGDEVAAGSGGPAAGGGDGEDEEQGADEAGAGERVVEATVTVPRDVEATVEVSGDVEATVEVPRDVDVTTQIRAVRPPEERADEAAAVPERAPGRDVRWWLLLLLALALWVVGFELAVVLQRSGVHWALSSLALVPGSYLLVTRLVRRH